MRKEERRSTKNFTSFLVLFEKPPVTEASEVKFWWTSQKVRCNFILFFFICQYQLMKFFVV
jgi:hypothetical protein